MSLAGALCIFHKKKKHVACTSGATDGGRRRRRPPSAAAFGGRLRRPPSAAAFGVPVFWGGRDFFRFCGSLCGPRFATALRSRNRDRLTVFLLNTRPPGGHKIVTVFGPFFKFFYRKSARFWFEFLIYEGGSGRRLLCGCRRRRQPAAAL